MSAFTGGFDKVNGASLAGEFLTGTMNYYTVASLVPMAQTNVTTPVAYLYTQQGYSVWQPVTVYDGNNVAQTYNTQSAYQDAYNQQANLDYLVKAFATRANPVALSVTTVVNANPSTIGLTGYSYSTNFGSGYSSSTNVTSVKFATERGSLWLVSGTTTGLDDNVDGYQLLDTLQAIPQGVVQDLSTPVLNTSYVNFETLNTTYRNTIAIVSANL
jgi:hypothetical protein